MTAVQEAGYCSVFPIVLDCGSYSCKAGFSSDDLPRVVFPCNKRKTHFSSRPVFSEHGLPTNWDDVEYIYHRAIVEELNVVSEEHPVVLTEQPLTPRACREKNIQLFFETFNVPGLMVAKSPELAARAVGPHQGPCIVVDIGESQAHVSPLYEGVIMPYAICTLPLAGKDVTAALEETLRQRDLIQSFDLEPAHIRAIKQANCFVSMDFNRDMLVPPVSQQSEFLACQRFTFGVESFSAPELLFQPVLSKQLLNRQCGSEMLGIHALVAETMRKCENDFRLDVQATIVLVGGTTLLPGFPERLVQEIKALLRDSPSPPPRKFQVTAVPERQYLSWIGGAMLAEDSSCQNQWISKEEYDECGPSVGRRMPY